MSKEQTRNYVYNTLSSCTSLSELADTIQMLKESGYQLVVTAHHWGTPENEDIMKVMDTYVFEDLLPLQGWSIADEVVRWREELEEIWPSGQHGCGPSSRAFTAWSVHMNGHTDKPCFTHSCFVGNSGGCWTGIKQTWDLEDAKEWLRDYAKRSGPWKDHLEKNRE